MALYAVLHETIYEVAPAELVGRTWLAATSSAGKMLRDEFDGDAGLMVAFMRWVWKRERGREKWRRDQGRSGGRLGWRLQFQRRDLLTEYRIDMKRSS